jgi:acetylornithine deacetylase
MNIAGMDGGVAFNVIPSMAVLTFSVRPSPGVDREALLRQIRDTAIQAASPLTLEWEEVAYNPAFATRDLASFEALLGSRVDSPVDLPYGTEAGQFVEAGIDAVVYGPGRVEQAHAADEFVELDELEEAVRILGQALG